MTKPILAVFLVCALASASAADPTLTIDAGESVVNVSPILYGLMTEEINHSYDGGLYAELIQNRAFLDNPNAPAHWSLVQGNGSAATMALDPSQPLNRELTTSLRLDVTEASQEHPAGIANSGYWGIPVKPMTRYHASFYAKAAPGFFGTVTVSIQADDSSAVYAKGEVSGLTQDWKQFKITLETGNVDPTAKARYVLTLDRPGTVWFDLVSLFPPTWDKQPNGFRPDLMQMLVDLNPKFLRFPGGNYVEGDTIATRFNWKKTIGPLSQRPGHPSPWGYRSTDGMGLLEFLKWCEDMGAEPVLAVYAGYSLDGQHVNPGPDLEPCVQNALDEIEYVIGPVTTKWGAERAKDGHPQPFPLHYVEIGNEDWFDRSGSYDARFQQFFKAIKAKYPQIKCISTVGNEQPASKRVHSCQPDMLDEHYYRPARTFLNDSAHFDHYNREGPEIFVGEWAAYETSFPPWTPRSAHEPPTPDMMAALGDAAWMTAMERNSDIVKMQCYAPLLVNVNPGARQWRPDLIGYNTLRCYGSPSYYAIRMFSRNVGDEILEAWLDDSMLHYSVTKDSQNGAILIKLVNPQATPQPLALDIKGVNALKPTGTAITLAAAPEASNSIDDPTNVVPVTAEVSGVKPMFDYTLPADSVTVLRLDVQ
ncbi:MAG TPA: alpha-L-arabinofuranosidase C-terminal domain-containing protein [Candidatus Saccharimonadales bacterium]|nr:alpha-L-arabinofuranosidase C-terminal domain-containing protein [Candidatus Saccharimonadales bacterium]